MSKLKSYSHDSRHSFADLLEWLVIAENMVDANELKAFKQSMYILKNSKFREEKIISEYSQFIERTHKNYTNEISDPDLANLEDKFIALSWNLSDCLKLVEDASRYPLEKHGFQNFALLDKKENKAACMLIDKMMTEFLAIIVAVVFLDVTK